MYRYFARIVALNGGWLNLGIVAFTDIIRKALHPPLTQVVFGLKTNFADKIIGATFTYLPATWAFSTKARAASRPLS